MSQANSKDPRGDTQMIVKKEEPSITLMKENTYKIVIPNEPNEVKFIIKIASTKYATPIRVIMQKPQRAGETYLMESQYPIYDKQGKPNAFVITQRCYNQKMIQETETTLNTSMTVKQADSLLYSMTQQHAIKAMKPLDAVEAPMLEDQTLVKLTNKNLPEGTAPFVISQGIEIHANRKLVKKSEMSQKDSQSRTSPETDSEIKKRKCKTEITPAI